MADHEGIKVMVPDSDNKNGIDQRIKEFEGNPVDVFQGVDDVDPARVDKIQTALFK
jgi:hypothetical protein